MSNCSINHYNYVTYSKTSNNGPSEKRTTSVQRTVHLPPIDFSIELNTFRTSEKRTPLNSDQRTLISPQRILANTKLPPKTDSEDNAGACRPLSLRHRCWIQRPSTTVALLRIVLATERFENATSSRSTIDSTIRESVDSLCRDGADAQYMQYLSKSRITSPQTRKKLI